MVRIHFRSRTIPRCSQSASSWSETISDRGGGCHAWICYAQSWLSESQSGISEAQAPHSGIRYWIPNVRAGSLTRELGSLTFKHASPKLKPGFLILKRLPVLKDLMRLSACAFILEFKVCSLMPKLVLRISCLDSRGSILAVCYSISVHTLAPKIHLKSIESSAEKLLGVYPLKWHPFIIVIQ